MLSLARYQAVVLKYIERAAEGASVLLYTQNFFRVFPSHHCKDIISSFHLPGFTISKLVINFNQFQNLEPLLVKPLILCAHVLRNRGKRYIDVKVMK